MPCLFFRVQPDCARGGDGGIEYPAYSHHLRTFSNPIDAYCPARLLADVYVLQADVSPVTSLTGSGKICTHARCKSKGAELPMSHFIKWQEPFLAKQCVKCRKDETEKIRKRHKPASSSTTPAGSDAADAQVAVEMEGSSTVPIFAEFCPSLTDLALEVARHASLEPESRGVPNLLLLYDTIRSPRSAHIRIEAHLMLPPSVFPCPPSRGKVSFTPHRATLWPR